MSFLDVFRGARDKYRLQRYHDELRVGGDAIYWLMPQIVGVTTAITYSDGKFLPPVEALDAEDKLIRILATPSKGLGDGSTVVVGTIHAPNGGNETRVRQMMKMGQRADLAFMPEWSSDGQLSTLEKFPQYAASPVHGNYLFDTLSPTSLLTSTIATMFKRMNYAGSQNGAMIGVNAYRKYPSCTSIRRVSFLL